MDKPIINRTLTSTLSFAHRSRISQYMQGIVSIKIINVQQYIHVIVLAFPSTNEKEGTLYIYMY
jgi:hypothetical protein